MHALIKAGLDRPWYSLRLPGDLETRYRAETAPANGRYVQSWLAVFILFNILSLPFDLEAFGPEAVWIPVCTTLGVFVPVALGAMLALRGRPSPLRQTAAATVTALTDMGVVLNSARITAGDHANTYLVIAAIVPLVVGIIAPMPFRHTLAFCAAAFAQYVIYVAAIGPGVGGGIPLLVASLILVPLKLSYARERETKRSFLIGLRERDLAAELVQANARLLVLSETDPLTGLANRRLFDVRLAAAWAEAGAEAEWLGLILVDIDHFKSLNDTAGHAEGDRCLVQVAAALRGCVDATGGLAARYGGEEFAVFLPRATPEAALAMGEALRRAVSGLGIVHPGRPRGACLSVSIGVTAAQGLSAALGLAIPDLLRIADAALYQAKAAGRDRVAGALPDLAANRNADAGGRALAARS